MKQVVVIFAILTPMFFACTQNERANAHFGYDKNLQNGDIIFQTSRSSQSLAIQLATKSKYSHMGIVYIIKGKPYVYEAIQPVTLTALNDWIRRGKGSHYVVKRLRHVEVLTHENLRRMRIVGERYSGKNYDSYFEWSDDRMYCSELVWKIYKEALNIELGEPQKLGSFDLTNLVVKQKLTERYGDTIPLNENVISPATIFASDQLVTVLRE